MIPSRPAMLQGWALPAVSSGLNQAPSLRAQASDGAPATNSASILHLSFNWTFCCPRACAEARGLSLQEPQAQGRKVGRDVNRGYGPSLRH